MAQPSTSKRGRRSGNAQPPAAQRRHTQAGRSASLRLALRVRTGSEASCVWARATEKGEVWRGHGRASGCRGYQQGPQTAARGARTAGGAAGALALRPNPMFGTVPRTRTEHSSHSSTSRRSSIVAPSSRLVLQPAQRYTLHVVLLPPRSIRVHRVACQSHVHLGTQRKARFTGGMGAACCGNLPRSHLYKIVVT